ncbi:MAG: hypothetical protein ABGY95_08595 [Rubritalea sp.]|uniref:hypothetical protein n=1 Tax=Rubritalea sp. TaxID=2109375 RepID=UPI003242E182
MNIMQELVTFLIGCIVYMWADGVQLFLITLAVALVLAAFCWWGCSKFTLLWNNQFKVSSVHHLLCGVAAIFTAIFVIVFSSLRYTKDVAELSIDVWNVQILIDDEWKGETFEMAYDAVYELQDEEGNQLEDFSNAPHPSTGESSNVPVNKQESRVAVAKVFADSAVENFDYNRPLLSKFLWGGNSTSEAVLVADVNRFFEQNPGVSYPRESAVNIAVAETKKSLNEQAPKLVLIGRFLLVGLFVLFQLLPFSVIAWAAYRDIKVRD